MKALRSILVALLVVAAATPALALRNAEIRRYAAEATLLTYTPRDGTMAYAMDTDTMWVMQNSIWVAVTYDTKAVTGVTTLAGTDCGKTMLVTAAADDDLITLPATIAGCTYTFMYTGADDGAKVEISPAAADGIHGSCTLAASVLEFSGTDNVDVLLTKATANTADTITIVGDGSVGWFVTACTGIWANP